LYFFLWGQNSNFLKLRRLKLLLSLFFYYLSIISLLKIGDLINLFHNILFNKLHKIEENEKNKVSNIPTLLESPVAASSLWHKDVPLKFVLFSWRLFRDRLPTKDNLFRRGVIDQASMLCVVGCDSLESSNHLFLHCNVFGSIWHLIYRWLDISAAVLFHVPDHFNQFSYNGGISKDRRSILHVIWFAIVWEIWKERNNRLFNVKECSVIQVVDKIKSLTFAWLKAKFASLPFNYHGWWLSLFTILGIG